jgi:hypothetical protein
MAPEGDVQIVPAVIFIFFNCWDLATYGNPATATHALNPPFKKFRRVMVDFFCF